MRVETDTFFFSHGQRPRGFGLWMFSLTGGGFDLGEFSHSGTFTEARKAAVAKAREVGASKVTALP